MDDTLDTPDYYYQPSDNDKYISRIVLNIVSQTTGIFSLRKQRLKILNDSWQIRIFFIFGVVTGDRNSNNDIDYHQDPLQCCQLCCEDERRQHGCHA